MLPHTLNCDLKEEGESRENWWIFFLHFYAVISLGVSLNELENWRSEGPGHLSLPHIRVCPLILSLYV